MCFFCVKLYMHIIFFFFFLYLYLPLLFFKINKLQKKIYLPVVMPIFRHFLYRQSLQKFDLYYTGSLPLFSLHISFLRQTNFSGFDIPFPFKQLRKNACNKYKWCYNFILTRCSIYEFNHPCLFVWWCLTGADPGFQVKGEHLKKIFFWVFRVKNHDFMQKKIRFFFFQF